LALFFEDDPCAVVRLRLLSFNLANRPTVRLKSIVPVGNEAESPIVETYWSDALPSDLIDIDHCEPGKSITTAFTGLDSSIIG
jgi:hypothetical protein